MNDIDTYPEASIVINGEIISEGEAMTLRVALASYLAVLEDPNAMGSDETGRAIAEGYKRCAAKTLERMMAKP